MNRDNLAKKYQRSREYETVTLAEGWKRVRSDIEDMAYKVGQYAIYPGFKSELEHDKLIEARGLLKLVDQIEKVAEKRQHFENLLKEEGIDVK